MNTPLANILTARGHGECCLSPDLGGLTGNRGRDRSPERAAQRAGYFCVPRRRAQRQGRGVVGGNHCLTGVDIRVRAYASLILVHKISHAAFLKHHLRTNYHGRPQ